ncbi:hypothetical protein LOD99_13419 [Oopsacas minuta]|uniref:Uncharacterized protein n=1 Tax=Oopsacas minuta TaxID=111878 RepID=A0AAV7KKS9_9METZ|nr:hypothetical protein LOD99_13419 [Oopsacas minuta]
MHFKSSMVQISNQPLYIEGRVTAQSITLSVPPLCILSVLTCIFSGALTCFYGSIVYARGVDDVTAALNVSAPGVTLTSFCLFNNVSNFFPPEIENQFYFMETLIPSCQGLDRTAPYLLSVCAMTILCLIISLIICVVSIISLLSCTEIKEETALHRVTSLIQIIRNASSLVHTIKTHLII